MLKEKSVYPESIHIPVYLEVFQVRLWVQTKFWASGTIIVSSDSGDLDRMDMVTAERWVAAVQAQLGIERGLMLCGKR